VFLSAGGALLAWGDYGRRVSVTGEMLPADGLTRLAAPQAGRIVDLRVRDGDTVRRDEVLYVIGVDSSTRAGGTQEAVAALLAEKRDDLRAGLARQAEADRLEKARLVDEKAAAGREAVALDAEIAATEGYIAEVARFAETQRGLLERGLARSSDVETRLETLNSERMRLAGLRRERLQLAAAATGLEHDLAGFDLAAAGRLAEIRRQVIDTEQALSESEAKRELTVRAPRDGTVTGILARPGQTVGPGDPLLTILPVGEPLVAELLAPSEAIGFLRVGAPVLLRYQAFPWQKFGQHSGRVAMISRAALAADDLGQLAPETEDGQLYRVTVTPDVQTVEAYGRPEPLQAGMRVEAHVLVDTRPLYQWVLEPVYSLRGALGAPAEARS
ncbi:MAG TPA: HlyD family efflux transporter periplasmic adaptor subunit, partial [Amaricoccus sp.]|nr:HlyD family efflux transporter periplasmic adaptor subunit [Amaricoccus sp.]